MQDEKQKSATGWGNLSLTWKVVVGTLAGAAMAVGLTAGWKKIGSLIKGSKFEYKNIENDVNLGAISGAIASVFSHESTTERKIQDLEIENFLLKNRVERLTPKASFSQEVADEKNTPVINSGRS